MNANLETEPDYAAQGKAARARIRSGEITAHTSGLAPGNLQGNIVILPKAQAGDFLRFCLNNPKPCPVTGISLPGDPALPGLSDNIDMRTDLPKYRVWRHGELVDEPGSIADLWQDDFVTFVLGCSFTFEQALISGGIRMRHIENDTGVAMWRTNVPTMGTALFQGPMVVSMRPLPKAAVADAFDITNGFVHAHGTPVHVGDPAAIGIDDINSPDYGDAQVLEDGDVPVFWACGVTPQAALDAAKLPLVITHAPGSMLVTDVPGHIPPHVDYPFDALI